MREIKIINDFGNKISRTLIYLLNPSQKRKITGVAISEDLKPENKSFVYYKKMIK